MWIVALPSGKVVKETDGALWNDLEKKACLYVDEKHLNETGGKVFLTLAATKWEKARLRFRLEVRFSEIEDRYFCDRSSSRGNNHRLEDNGDEIVNFQIVTEDSRQGLIQIKRISRSMIIRKFLGKDAIFITGHISAQTPPTRTWKRPNNCRSRYDDINVAHQCK